MQVARRVGAIFVGFSFFSTAWSQTMAPGYLVENLPEHLAYLYSDERSSDSGVGLNQLVAKDRFWEPGRTLRVCLFGGNPVVARLIREAGSEWNKYSNVKFDFGPVGGWYKCLSPSEGYFQIRIGFSGKGFNSAIGTDAETRLEQYVPTMNLEGYNIRYSPSRMSAEEVMQKVEFGDAAVIKHEFGHALGLLHELQSPKMNCFNEIKWTGAGNVYEFLAKPPNGWTDPEQVRRNLGLVNLSDKDATAGEPDPASIMMYALPAAIFVKGDASPCFSKFNSEISERDKRIVAEITAPKGRSKASDLNLAAAAVMPISIAASAIELGDSKERIVADLESSDTFDRRNARARLATLIPRLSSAEVDVLIQGLAGKSYRYQLGVATAVAHAPRDFRLSNGSKVALSNRAKSAIDSTLKQQLILAAKR